MNINNKLNKKLLLINCSLPYNGSIYLLNQLKNYLNIINIKTEILNNDNFNKDNFKENFINKDLKELKYLIEYNNVIIYNNYDLLLLKNRNILNNIINEKYLKKIYIQNIQNKKIINYYKLNYKKIYNEKLIEKMYIYYKIHNDPIINYQIIINNNELKINNVSGYYESIITGFLQNFKFNHNNINLISENSNICNIKFQNNTKIITNYKKKFKDKILLNNNIDIIYTSLLEEIENFNELNNNLIILFQSLMLNIININYPLYIISNKNILKLLYFYFNYKKTIELNSIIIKDNILYTFKPNCNNYDLLLTIII